MKLDFFGLSPKWTYAISLALRVIVGALFIFSGFVKAVDPWGTLYKVDDYLGVLNIGVWHNLEVAGVFFLCCLEFTLGAMLILGCFRRSVMWATALVMAFMLPFSLWIAVYNPVADCGCFGDAFIISNWATFWKNVALSLAVLWLLKRNVRVHWLITPALQWMGLLATVAYVGVVSIIGYLYQPLLDFRPYKTGELFLDHSTLAASEPEYRFVYEKDGEKREFAATDELPDEDSGWTFVDRYEVKPQAPAPDAREEKNFRIWDEDDEDVTDREILSHGRELLLMMPKLSEVSIATTWKINSLYSWAQKHDVTMIGVVAGSKSEIDNWIDLSMASYPIFTADDTSIKEVVRGNPAVVYLQDGKVGWKSTIGAINVDDFMAPGTSSDPMSFQNDDHAVLRNFTLLYLAVVAALIMLSFSPKLLSLLRIPHKTPTPPKNPKT